MRVRSLGALLLTAGLAASLSGTPAARAVVTGADAGATPSALGVLAFGPGNVLFAADPQARRHLRVRSRHRRRRARRRRRAGSRQEARRGPRHGRRAGRDHRPRGAPDVAQRLPRRDARHGRRRGAGAGPPRRSRPSRRRRPRRPEVHVRGAAERAGRQPAGAPRPAGGVDHRHGLRERPADRGRPVERGVRLEAARGEVSVLAGRPRHQRRDLPRQPRGGGDALAGLRLRAVHRSPGRSRSSPATCARRWSRSRWPA